MLIKKNGTVLNVTKGAFKALFKDQGWTKVKSSEVDSGNKETTQKSTNFMSPQPEKDDIKSEDEEKTLNHPFQQLMENFNKPEENQEENDDDEVETPLTEMTVKQLEEYVEYADENGYDLGDATKKADIIQAILAAEEDTEE